MIGFPPRRRLCLAAMTFALLIAISACVPRVAMKSIPAEVIPEELKNDIRAMGSHGKPISDIVWRAYEIKDGRLFTACTYAQEMEPGVKLEVYWIWSADLDESGGIIPGTGGGAGGDFKPSDGFQGMTGSGGRVSDTGEPTYSLFAWGCCLDGRVRTIQGTTSDGRIVQTAPSGSFWYLALDNAGARERWTRVSGVDANGKPVVDLTISSP